MKTLRDFDVANKKVLVRCDFNVPLDEKQNITDDFRIKETLPTIKHLIERGAKIILMSHLGRPSGKKIKELSLEPVRNRLTELLGLSVIKTSDCIGEEVETKINQMKAGEILLLENLRFRKEEEENEESFAKELSQLGDIYINDAFSCCHRAHASIVGIPKYLPSGMGFLLEKEIKILSDVLEKPKRPLVVIIGGAKIETKIKVIEQFLEKADHLLLGGLIGNSILAVKEVLTGRLLPQEEVLEKIKKIELTNPKLHLPADALISTKDRAYIRVAALGSVRRDEQVLDIGPETIRIFSEIIKGVEISFWKGPLEYIKRTRGAKTILWSGPLGYVEEEQFAKGSLAIVDAIIKSKAFSIAGGGDTDAFLAKYNLRERFNHISTGGGAMLEFLSGEKLPGLEILE